MKHYAFILMLAIVMVSCGTDSRHFSVDGHLLNINSGEFYVYSPDAVTSGIDTIKVRGGRFTYETTCEQKGTLVIVFPNMSEVPVFTEPGKSVDMKGSVSHLKEIQVTGTKENKLMNAFREQTISASPPEMRKYAKMFIQDHPESVVSNYLLQKYFIMTGKPDYAGAAALLTKMIASQPDNGMLKQMKERLKGCAAASVGNSLPSFKAKALNGTTVSSQQLKAEYVTVINFWASWNFQSSGAQNVIKTLYNENKGKFKVISVCLDADKEECKKTLGQDSTAVTTICDGLLFEGNVAKTLGVCSVPDNIILKRGKIVARGIPTDQLRAKMLSLIQ